eukprot:1367365-Pyramimonas_sp.AAC.1
MSCPAALAFCLRVSAVLLSLQLLLAFRSARCTLSRPSPVPEKSTSQERSHQTLQQCSRASMILRSRLPDSRGIVNPRTRNLGSSP